MTKELSPEKTQTIDSLNRRLDEIHEKIKEALKNQQREDEL